MIAPARARHRHRIRSRCREGIQQLSSAPQGADRSRADAGSFEPPLLAREMVIERDGPEEVGQRDPKPTGYEANSVVRQEAVALVERVEQGKERSGLLGPELEQLIVRRANHR